MMSKRMKKYRGLCSTAASQPTMLLRREGSGSGGAATTPPPITLEPLKVLMPGGIMTSDRPVICSRVALKSGTG